MPRRSRPDPATSLWMIAPSEEGGLDGPGECLLGDRLFHSIAEDSLARD